MRHRIFSSALEADLVWGDAQGVELLLQRGSLLPAGAQLAGHQQRIEDWDSELALPQPVPDVQRRLPIAVHAAPQQRTLAAWAQTGCVRCCSSGWTRRRGKHHPCFSQEPCLLASAR